MGGRMADLCEELATAVKGLITVQTKLSETSSCEKLDSLVRTAASQFRVELAGGGGRDPAKGDYHGKKRALGSARREDTSSPASEANSLDSTDLDPTSWGKTEVKQPSVTLPRIPAARQNRSGGGPEEKRRPAAEDKAAETEVSDEVLVSPGARPRL